MSTTAQRQAKKAKIVEAGRLFKDLNKRGSRGLPVLSELAEHFITACEGPAKFAKMLFDEWTAATAGSMARVRIMDLICRVWKTDTTGKQSTDLNHVTDDDLERMLEETLSRHLDDGPEETASENPS